MEYYIKSFILLTFCIVSCENRKQIKEFIDPYLYVVKEVLAEDTTVLDGKYQEYISNELSYEAYYKKGLLDGKSTLYIYKLPIISSEYKKGKLDGKRSYYDYNGNLFEEKIYRSDKYMEHRYNVKIDSNLKDKFTFKNGNGIDLNLNRSNHRPQSIVTYKNGIKEGKYIKFIDDKFSVLGAFKNDTFSVDTWFYSSSFYKIDSIVIYSEDGKKLKKEVFKDHIDDRFGINSFTVSKEDLKILGFEY